MSGEKANNVNLKEQGDHQGQLKKHFAQCYEISYLSDGYSIPVGGSIFSDEQDVTLLADFGLFNDFFLETHELVGKYNLAELHNWLKEQDIEIDAPLFATLFGFTEILNKKYPINKHGEMARKKLYKETPSPVKLSDVFKEGCALCAEIAALAQAYLQQEHISSTYFSGDVLWKKGCEFSQKHTYILIHRDAKTYIYDPANPIQANVGLLPRISKPTTDFDQEMVKRERKFVTAIDLISKKPAYYGVNNGANVFAEKDIV